MARIVWTDRARDSLREISDFIATDAPERAKEVARRIFASVGEPKDFPNMGRKVPELDRDDIRALVTGNYRVVCRNSQDTVFVLAVVHGRQDFDSFWKPDGEG